MPSLSGIDLSFARDAINFLAMMFYMPRRQNSRGMSFIELAITISILGLMMFFALKGRAMIESIRAVAVAYQLENYQREILSYQVDYSTLPGDDPVAPNRWGRSISLSRASENLASLMGNGKIDGQLYDVTNPGGEQFAAWQDLRSGSKSDGDPKLEGVSTLPENPFGGFYGFDEGNLGQRGGSICATKIPGRAAQMIDARLDDGKINTGAVVATQKFSVNENNHFNAPDKDPYDFEKEYIICVPLLP